MASQQLDDERIFHTARRITDQEARTDYLDQICAGDLALRERVDALLDAHEQEKEFLRSAGPEPLPTVDQKPITEAPGQEVGRYRLLQKIGEGGFGVVFMAEQLRPVRRKVALKVIKPGMDSSAVVARFEAERQALALMDHPNIARVLDGGATDSGRPYFVMELVKGVPITEYCDKNQLTTEERLKLFIKVCQAVQHAHQKGIIHRDLKPSNVLVTLADGQPVVKVIDFGVAKATNQQLTEKTLFTAFGQMVGTPQYMSPEQAEMSCLDVDTRSDVYSLGVLLYELLTGTTPLEAERLRTAGYVEMQRLIREEEPPKPSTRLSTSGEKLTVIAKHRSISPARLKSQVRGDLDWIVMKAMEKDRNRRYVTPDDLAQDVARFLESGPVAARAPSAVYLLRKYARRNQIAVALGATILAALFVSIASLAIMLKVMSDNISQLRKTVHRDLFSAALSNDQDYFSDAIEQAELIGLANRDVKLAQAVQAINIGDYPQALDLVNVAEKLDDVDSLTQGTEGCISAIRCVAYFWGGSLDKAEIETEELLQREPTNGLETLLCAYALVGNRPKRALELIAGDEIARRTNSGVFVRAQAALLHAVDSRDGDLLMQSIGQLEVARELIGDTDATQGWLLDAYASAIVHFRRTGDFTTVERLEKNGRVVAQEFAGSNRYAWALWIFALSIDDPAMAKRACDAAAAGGDIEFYVAAHGLLFPDAADIRTRFAGLATEVDDLKLLAGAHHLRTDEHWMQKRLSSLLENESAFVRRHALSALCLYLDEDSIRQIARELYRGSRESGADHMWGANNCVRFFADPDFGPDELIASCNEHRFGLTNAYFSMAMLAIARRDREGAIEAFEKCVAEGGYGCTDDVLARGYLECMKRDRDWLPWIVGNHN